MSNRTLNLTNKLYDYLLSVSLRETPAQQHLRTETAKLSTAAMQISPEQGQFMALLTQLMGVRKAIEVGVYTGYSSLSVAQAMPADGKIIACDINKEVTQMAQQFWHQAGVAHKIDLHIGPAAKTMDALIEKGEAETYDFVFIDADKENYDNYYERALTLLRKGGLILIDNVLWDGAVIDPADKQPSTEAIRKLNKKLHHDDRVTISMVPIGDGLTLARKK